MIFYRFYGLNVASEIPLPIRQISPVPMADVTITLQSKAPFSIEGTRDINGFKLRHDGAVLFDTGQGRILIEEGESIKIKLTANADLSVLAQYILSSGLAVVLQQRKILVLHASAVAKNGKALLISGKSGFGKSSTAVLLQNQGYEVLSDDLSVILFKDGIPYVQPGPPVQKIATDVLAHLKEAPLKAAKTMADGRLKYFRPFEHKSEAMIPVHSIYCLAKDDTSRSELLKASDLEQFNAVYRNSFRFRLIGPLGFAKEHMDLCTDLYKKVTTKTLVLPNAHLDFDNTVWLLDRDFSQNQDLSD